jgi:hypothetical protein
MNSRLSFTLLVALGLAAPLQAGLAADKPLEKEAWNLVEAEATVVAINASTREVTLQDAAGNLATVIAGEAVERFDEIQVGDSVRSEYWTYLRAEFREPTAEEQENPLLVLAEAGQAPPESAPAAEVGALIKAVVKVVAIDTAGREVAIQGPRGRIEILPVLDDAVLNNLEVGEPVIMTYVQAIALSLDKAE